MADHFRAKLIILVAFDFEKVGKYTFNTDPLVKFKKLTWANLLLGLLKDSPVRFYKED